MSYFTKPFTNPRPEECRAQPWFAIDGDRNLRVDYNLSRNSIAYDIGGYHGDWADSIYNRYGCTIEVFEPVQEFVTKLEKRFSGKSKIKIRPFGLSGRTRESKIVLDKASSSIFKKGNQTEKIKLVSVSEYMHNQSKRNVDLMKINIEGGEYDLLNDLIKSGLIKRVKDVQVQFHIFVPRAVSKRQKLHQRLSKTHYLTYNYPWIWENWRLKK